MYYWFRIEFIFMDLQIVWQQGNAKAKKKNWGGYFVIDFFIYILFNKLFCEQFIDIFSIKTPTKALNVYIIASLTWKFLLYYFCCSVILISIIRVPKIDKEKSMSYIWLYCIFFFLRILWLHVYRFVLFSFICYNQMTQNNVYRNAWKDIAT